MHRSSFQLRCLCIIKITNYNSLADTYSIYKPCAHTIPLFLFGQYLDLICDVIVHNATDNSKDNLLFPSQHNGFDCRVVLKSAIKLIAPLSV